MTALPPSRPRPPVVMLANPEMLPGLIAVSDAMRSVCRLVQQAAPSDASVLLVGETGTGKEVVARAVARLSRRADGPYVRVNCGALHENLLESELFGHIKGSFTGATENKAGRFEAAHGGTIFLDEVNSMSPALQVKLLRVLQDGQFERVGDTATRRVDVRVVAASNELLEPLIAAGKFREDLYYRLNVVPVFVPPLRVRVDDIEPLARFFLDRFATENNLPTPPLTPDLLRRLQAHAWPGNVRELENAAERLVVLSPSVDVLDMNRPSFAFRGRGGPAADDLKSLVKQTVRAAVAVEGVEGKLHEHLMGEVERELIAHVMSTFDGVQTKAAKLLGMNRNTLHKKLNDPSDGDPEWVI